MNVHEQRQKLKTDLFQLFQLLIYIKLTYFSNLLRSEAFQLLLQPSPQPQLQLLPLLARCLQLSERTLQPLHFLHVGPLPEQLLLQQPVAGLLSGQSLLQQLFPPLTFLPRKTQMLDLPLQLLTLTLLLFV